MTNDSRAAVQKNNTTFLSVLRFLVVISMELLQYHETREILSTVIVMIFYSIIVMLIDRSFIGSSILGIILIMIFFNKYQTPGYFYYNAKIILLLICASYNMYWYLKDRRIRNDFPYELVKYYSKIHVTTTFIMGILMEDLIHFYVKKIDSIMLIPICLLYLFLVTKVLKLSNKLQMLLIIILVALSSRLTRFRLYPIVMSINLVFNMIYYSFFYSKYKDIKKRDKEASKNVNNNVSYSYTPSSYKSYSSNNDNVYSTSGYKSKTFSRNSNKYNKKSSPSYSSSYGDCTHYDNSGGRSGYSYKDKYGNAQHYDSDGARSGYSYKDEYGHTEHYGSDGARRGFSRTDEYGNTEHYDSDGARCGYSTTDEDGNTTHYDADGAYKGCSY